MWKVWYLPPNFGVPGPHAKPGRVPGDVSYTVKPPVSPVFYLFAICGTLL